MAELLVSIRSVEEAASALAGGAHLIDVKEPRLGSLGRADEAIIADVIRFVDGRRPVSAAFGELLADRAPFCYPSGLSFVKWGLAGCGRLSHWPSLLAARTLRAPEQPPPLCKFVHVAYADWQCAQAPPLQEVVDLACGISGNVLLIDTCCKTSSGGGRRATLLDWLPLEEVIDLCHRCRDAQIRVALAGSISMCEIDLLRPARPAWFAVRGAVCAGGERDSMVQESRVRELVQLLRA